MLKKPRGPRIALQIDPELRRRIAAAHRRIRAHDAFASLSTTVRALIEAGLERDEANHAAKDAR